MSEIHDRTAARLEQFYDFPDDLVGRVADLADRQAAASTFSELLAIHGLEYDKIVKKIEIPGQKKLAEVLDIPAVGDHSPADVDSYQLWQATGMTPNVISRAVAIHALRGRRLIALAQPGSPGMSTGKVAAHDAMSVIRGGDTRPLVDASLQYASNTGAKLLNQFGHSRGANASGWAAQHAYRYDIQTNRVVKIDPSRQEGLGTLTLAFLKTGLHMGQYVKMTDQDEPFHHDAVKKSENPAAYLLGNLRLTNLASAVALQRGDDAEISERNLLLNPDMTQVDMWFTDSELCQPALMNGSASYLHDKFPGRYSSAELDGYHNAVNYTPIHTAAALYGLELGLAA